MSFERLHTFCRENGFGYTSVRTEAGAFVLTLSRDHVPLAFGVDADFETAVALAIAQAEGKEDAQISVASPTSEWQTRAEKAEREAAYWKQYASDSDAQMIAAGGLSLAYQTKRAEEAEAENIALRTSLGGMLASYDVLFDMVKDIEPIGKTVRYAFLNEPLNARNLLNEESEKTPSELAEENEEDSFIDLFELGQKPHEDQAVTEEVMTLRRDLARMITAYDTTQAAFVEMASHYQRLRDWIVAAFALNASDAPTDELLCLAHDIQREAAASREREQTETYERGRIDGRNEVTHAPIITSLDVLNAYHAGYDKAIFHSKNVVFNACANGAGETLGNYLQTVVDALLDEKPPTLEATIAIIE